MQNTILELLKTEVKPAMGCTEPVAITLCAAKAREISTASYIERFELELSPNLYKNALGVGIPHSDVVGLDIATAIGLVGGDSELGLKIYESITDAIVEEAKELLKVTPFTIKVANTGEKILIVVRLFDSIGEIEVLIKQKHNNIYKITKYGEVVYQADDIKVEEGSDLANFFKLSIRDIVKEVEIMDTRKFEFLLDGLEMNKKISAVGLKSPLGAKIGYTIKASVDKGLLSDDLPTKAMYLTAAASDARMSGITLAVMSSNGSGNNGLTAILPIVAYLDGKDISSEETIRALAISHLINCYIKNEIGRLSALCSCAISAATSASVAITYLEGGTYEQMEGSINNMVGNLSGMICDGAKDGCAMKLATAASTAIYSSILSMSGAILKEKNGIVGRTAEESIKNLGILSAIGMKQTDSTILDIMQEMN
ncbi:MAG: L-serine ammonia-lyase, iron-sulfur-dependent, subunit alpha [Acidaminobacteraceae bacterium]